VSLTILPAYLVILGHTAVALVLGWLYFRRYRVTRPPVGVINLADVAMMVGGIILIPYLYLALPPWLVGALLALGTLSVLYFTAEPILRTGWSIWLAVGILAAADVGAALRFGAASMPFFVVNNAALIVVAVGIANLWAQSVMKARDLAVLGAALTLYDFVFTTQLPLMGDLVGRLAELPFAPLVAWPVGGDGRWLGIGLGDLLLATAFPLVMHKAFGRAAGLAALSIALGTLAVVLALPERALGWETFPVMLMLGPLIVLQYALWAHRRRRERTTWEYLQAEPLPKPDRMNGERSR
jgi:hypothetical protein